MELKTYSFSILGRKAGALGVYYKITEKYIAPNLSDALYQLHTQYEVSRYLKTIEGTTEIDRHAVMSTEAKKGN